MRTVALIPYGLVGVGIAISVTEIAVGIVLVVLARPVTGCTAGELLRALVPPLVAVTAALAAVQLWRAVGPASTGSVLGEALHACADAAVLLGGFLLASVLVQRSFRDLLRTGLHRWRDRRGSGTVTRSRRGG